eukprot:15108444-Alexandrium_andersonii.AAC.1
MRATESCDILPGARPGVCDGLLRAFVQSQMRTRRRSLHTRLRSSVSIGEGLGLRLTCSCLLVGPKAPSPDACLVSMPAALSRLRARSWSLATHLPCRPTCGSAEPC